MLTFHAPSSADRAAVLACRAEILRCRADFDGSAGLGEFERYSEWLERLRLLSGERAEKYGFYRTVVRLAYDGTALVGILNVRLTDDPFIRTYAGHIGYNVRPSCRRRGYGRACAVEGVRLCAEHGITEPVICTDPDNPASRKTAESAGFTFTGLETTESGITVARFIRATQR